MSSLKNVICGNHLDSVLGPLFILYINDFTFSITILHALFSDDIRIFYSNEDLENLTEIIHSEHTSIN